MVSAVDGQSIICAVDQAKSVSPVVGIALVNMTMGEVVLCQICDNQSYVKTIHKLQLAAPSRILFKSNACPPHRDNLLLSLAQELMPGTRLDALDRPAWSDRDGLEKINDVAFPADTEPIKVAVEGKQQVLNSFAAVRRLHYRQVLT